MNARKLARQGARRRHHGAAERLLERLYQILPVLRRDVEPARFLGETFRIEEALRARPPEILQLIADIIRESGRRLVIEDFHYMSVEERAAFAFDLKALWDYGVFVIIIGVWSQSNMLIHLNPDLSGRIEEVSIYWSDDDLALPGPVRA